MEKGRENFTPFSYIFLLLLPPSINNIRKKKKKKKVEEKEEVDIGFLYLPFSFPFSLFHRPSFPRSFPKEPRILSEIDDGPKIQISALLISNLLPKPYRVQVTKSFHPLLTIPYLSSIILLPLLNSKIYCFLRKNQRGRSEGEHFFTRKENNKIRRTKITYQEKENRKIQNSFLFFFSLAFYLVFTEITATNKKKRGFVMEDGGRGVVKIESLHTIFTAN